MPESYSLYRAACTDFPDPLSLPISIVYRFRQFLQATSCISTELLKVGSSRSFNICSSIWGGLQVYIAYEFILLSSPTVSYLSSSSIGRFSWWVVGGLRDAVLWSVASRTNSIQFTAFLRNWSQPFSPYTLFPCGASIFQYLYNRCFVITLLTDTSLYQLL